MTLPGHRDEAERGNGRPDFRKELRWQAIVSSKKAGERTLAILKEVRGESR